MDRETLAAMLAEGRSIESIARETGRAPSTVAYWVNKYGLTLPARTSSRRRGRDRARASFEALVEEGLSVRQIAARCDVSARRRCVTGCSDTSSRHSPRVTPGATRPKPDDGAPRMQHARLGLVRARGCVGRVSLRSLQRAGGHRAASARQGDSRRRGGRTLRHLRIRRVRRRAPVPPPRSGDEGVRGQPPGDHPLAASASAWRPRNACYCARTATRWLRLGC